MARVGPQRHRGKPPPPFNRRLFGSQRWSGSLREEKYHAPAEVWTTIPRLSSPQPNLCNDYTNRPPKTMLQGHVISNNWSIYIVIVALKPFSSINIFNNADGKIDSNSNRKYMSS